jgi:short-subunit dehydrogenase
MKKHFQNKTIWITGASSGIGKALAVEFSKYHVKLILSGRQTAELERIAVICKNNGSSVQILCFDLSDNTETEKAADKVIQEFGGADILINNGGVSQRSLLIDTPVSIDRRIMEIDYFSGVTLTKKLLPGMLQKDNGHIVAMSSVTGLFGFPMRSAYSAAKHAMQGFYETLWAELNTKGIHVTIVCPGRIQTNVSINAVTETGQNWGQMDKGQNAGISAEKCAKIIIRAIYRKKKSIIIARKEFLLIWLKKFIPYLFYKLVVKVKPT